MKEAYQALSWLPEQRDLDLVNDLLVARQYVRPVAGVEFGYRGLEVSFGATNSSLS